MNQNTVRAIVITALMFIGSAVLSEAASPRPAAAAMCSKLIKAIEISDYEVFLTDAEPAFKQLKKEQFEAVAAQLAPRLQAGYEVAILGELRQRGYEVTLWRIRFKNGGDDALVSLSMKDGKVGGFFVQ